MTERPLKKKGWKEFDITDGGVRLDVWLSSRFSGLSRRSAKLFIDAQNVSVNGRYVSKGQLLTAGDRVTIMSEPPSRNWRPEPNEMLPLDVLSEDDGFVVVNKPSGMPSTAISPSDSDTLANAIVARYPECAGIGLRNGDGGLVHRLDNDTSGLLIAARTVRAFKALKNMQESNHIEKRYVALVDRLGTLGAPSTISVPLDATRKGSKKMAVAKHGGQRAVTHVEEISAAGDCFVVNVLIYKGVRHQIRVHLAQQGAPICGDHLYGGAADVSRLDRLFLHASGLKFFHPVSAAPVEIHCPLPRELQWVVDGLS